MMDGRSVLIVATMKNEGPYVLEWVAHHLSIGVDGILVFTNDCDDLTDRILDRLGDLAPVYHQPNPKALFPNKGNWHVMAIRYARLFNRYKDAGWIFHTDADEFLQIKCGAGTLADFHAAASARSGRFDAVSFTSYPYSSNGRKTLEDRPVVEQFTRTNKPYARLKQAGEPAMNAVKTMFRNDVDFDLRRNHRPLMPGFSAAGHVWIDGSANVMPPEFTDGDAKIINAIGSTDLAQMNHYAIKSAEAFLVKLDRGDAMGLSRLGANGKYWESYDTKGETDERFAEGRPEARKLFDELKSDRILSEMHAEAFAVHKAKAKRMRADPAFAELLQRLGLSPESAETAGGDAR